MTYRGRETHLRAQLAWWQHQNYCHLLSSFEVLVIEVSETVSSWIPEALRQTNIRYIHCPCKGAFHKTKALNLGLALSNGEFIVPYDVDLVPVDDTLVRQLSIAEQSSRLLITGYRLMSDRSSITVEDCAIALEQSYTAPEDQPTALWKHLVRREKFGVIPFFRRDRLIAIGAWDEQFIGWGAEDQDIIERYLLNNYYLCRCPELVYLHLFHYPDSEWTEPVFVEQNRHHYYRSRNYRSRKLS